MKMLFVQNLYLNLNDICERKLFKIENKYKKMTFE
jgi:hypothetical protein